MNVIIIINKYCFSNIFFMYTLTMIVMKWSNVKVHIANVFLKYALWIMIAGKIIPRIFHTTRN